MSLLSRVAGRTEDEPGEQGTRGVTCVPGLAPLLVVGGAVLGSGARGVCVRHPAATVAFQKDIRTRLCP